MNSETFSKIAKVLQEELNTLTVSYGGTDNGRIPGKDVLKVLLTDSV
jgi:hypothetical protein